MDNCPERMHAADAEAPRPPRIETVVEFCSGMGVETAARMQAVDTCPERMYAVDTGALAMRRYFWSPRKKRNKKKKQVSVDCFKIREDKDTINDIFIFSI